MNMNLVKQDTSTIFLQQNIRLLRKRLKLSQEEMANRVGLNRGNIASYENGTAEPKICNLLKIANLFGISIIDITQKDLSDKKLLSEASSSYQNLSSNELELMDQFLRRSEELEKVFQSIHTCFLFKAKCMDEEMKDSKEMQMVAMKFEELFDTCQQLMQNHRSLIEFVTCRFGL
ncbi:MAG: helix-turn-helix transcriptional regulator [Lewinellaceae bacterium]|nr:helix-turn-helix transcriptional regulator [Phaeodactylibacter sp.]MCB9040135.1 helix-turn-helix transcriptional regulator [Lewinellaceae bacterium]